MRVSANCKYPKDVKEILADAYSDWDTLAEHCVKSHRLPIAKSIAESPVFLENKFLNSFMYMTDYSFFMPYQEDNQRWMDALYQAVYKVENGSSTPGEAAHIFGSSIEEEKMKNSETE